MTSRTTLVAPDEGFVIAVGRLVAAILRIVVVLTFAYIVIVTALLFAGTITSEPRTLLGVRYPIGSYDPDSAGNIATDYVRAHLDRFGLSRGMTDFSASVLPGPVLATETCFQVMVDSKAAASPSRYLVGLGKQSGAWVVTGISQAVSGAWVGSGGPRALGCEAAASS